MHQLSFNKFDFVASKPLELVHSDVWGPASVISINDFRYYLVLIDEYSKFTWVYLLKNKSNVFDIFKYFKAYVENQLNISLKVLRTNGGGELPLMLLIFYALVMESYTKLHVLIPHNKMVQLRENIDILLNVLSPCSHTLIFLYLTGLMQCPLQHI